MRKESCKWYWQTSIRVQKQPSRGVLGKSCSENMQQTYRRIPMPECDFNKVASLRHGCSPVNLLHIFRTPFPKNTSEGLLLRVLEREVLVQKTNCFLTRLIWDCKRRDTNLVMSWINYRKTCDMVPYRWIKKCLELFLLTKNMHKFLGKSMEGMVEKWDLILGPSGPLGLPIPQDPMDPRDSQSIWTLGPPETSGPQNRWEITSTIWHSESQYSAVVLDLL